MGRQVVLQIRAVVPDKAGYKEIRGYCVDALGSWGGSLQPPGVDEGGLNPDAQGDVMFSGIEVRSVSVFNKSPKHPDKRQKQGHRGRRRHRNKHDFLKGSDNDHD